MALEEYHAKRDFGQTTEPKGAAHPTGSALKFVVQKHGARQLHYDFRLEIGGVMVSWAVPKGPSLDPEEKRLAMMTEDHPMEYRQFEGTIPHGHYGAGTVMVWDEGNYTERSTAEIKAAEKALKHGLHVGHITFVLNGHKLKGEFALIKLKNAEDKAWLLVKKGDQFASGKDILKQDKSALSGRTMAQIAKAPEVWLSGQEQTDLSGAPKQALPKQIKPMLATLVDEPFDDNDWRFEIKWDGYRMIALIDKKRVHLQSRGGQDYTKVFKPVADQLADLERQAVLDGEMVVVDEAGRSHFQGLQNYQRTGQGELRYIVFDLLHLDGHDLTGLSLARRKELLRELLPKASKLVLYSDDVVGEGQKFYEAAAKSGLEGIMAKRASSPYQLGKRGGDWLKIKIKQSQEAIICGWTEPRGSRKHIGALILGAYSGHELVYIGHTAGRLGEQDLADLHKQLARIEVAEPPFQPVPRTNAPAHWCRPKVVAQIAFEEWTDDGHLRQPIFLGLRHDKSAAQVKIERPVESKPTVKTKAELTNLDKVYWPKDGYTKGDLVSYYDAVAELLLPYLKDRPESLHRYPGGITGDSFYQKNVEQGPGWLKTVSLHSGSQDRSVHYLICNDRDTLLYMANLGCIEINPWHSRTGQLDNPDYCVIDLDPEGVDYDAVVTVAQMVRETLDKLNVPAYPKTSGATGLHIYIPLGAKYDDAQSRQFAQLVANLVHQQLPQLTSVERSPAKRHHRVYLDYLQNPRGQTLASVYSVRPQPGATVSTPLEWREVKKGLRPSQFTIKTVPKRFDKVGDLWKPVLGKGIDLKKVLKSAAALIEPES